jgi:hypothetical protein
VSELPPERASAWFATCASLFGSRVTAGGRGLQDKSAMCLELLGERNERVEQLEMDNSEMRWVYKQQLCVLADQVVALSTAAPAGELAG